MILNLAPDFDAATVYSAKWNKQLMDELNEKHSSLLAKDAIRWNFEGHVKELDPDLVIFYDHGSENALIGNDMRPLLDSRNVGLLKGKEIYTMCCLTAQKLGAEAYRKGCLAWWGYTKVFSFVTTDEKIFCTLANMGLILRRTDHLSWKDCVTRVKDAYNDEIDKGGNPWTIISLINNRDALVCWSLGNEPSTNCFFRRVGISIFGKAGHHITKKSAASLGAFFIFWGITAHAIASELYYKGGYTEILSLQGEWIGLAGILAAYMIFVKEHMEWLS